MAATATFRILVPGGSGADVLGLWQVVPGDESSPVWEVDVRGTNALAALQQPAAQLADVAEALPAAERRLQRFVQASLSPQLTFAAPSPDLAAPERRLAAWLAPVEAQPFALGGLRSELDETLRRATDFARQLRRIAGQATGVRSSAAGRALGMTRVSWQGDLSTVWAAGLGPADLAVHNQAVQLALVTFQSWLRIITLVGAGAVQLSLLLPSGIGAIMGLPAAWRFITDILAEVRHLRALPA